jgi:hypothetical protein
MGFQQNMPQETHLKVVVEYEFKVKLHRVYRFTHMVLYVCMHMYVLTFLGTRVPKEMRCLKEYFGHG